MLINFERQARRGGYPTTLPFVPPRLSVVKGGVRVSNPISNFKYLLLYEILQNRTLLRLQEFQGSYKHSGLESRVVGKTQGAAQFEGHPQSPGWPYYFGVLPYQADLGRRYIFLFQVMRKPAHGARAVRSDRNQDDSINRISFKQSGQLAGLLFHVSRIGGSHKGEVVIPNASDNATIRQFI